jgi:hypothetical protein
MGFNVEVVAGNAEPISVPATAVNTQIISGDCYLNGWSLRDAQGTVIANVEGSVTAPTSGQAICTTPSLPVYEYDLNWTVSLEGAAAVADQNNFEVTAGAAVIATSLNPGVAGVYPQPQANYMRASAGTFSVKAVGAGTAGVLYSATLQVVPVATDLTVVEFMDGARYIGEQSIAQGASETRDFGAIGLTIYSGVTMNVLSGMVQGTVYCRFAKAC